MPNQLKPDPIRTTETNWFAWNTMSDRMPRNIRNAVASNPQLTASDADRMLALADQIAANATIPAPALPAHDYDEWMLQFEPRRGETWHDSVWFFAETYAFRLVMDACRFWERGIDPFRHIKMAELDSGAAFAPVLAIAEAHQNQLQDPASQVTAAMHASIWGNRSDLSFSAGGELDRSAGDSSLLIVNDDITAAQRIVSSTGALHIVMDNAGAELVGDLLLALAVIRNSDAEVVLHVKSHPTYVSDTTVEDFHITVDRARRDNDARVRAFGQALFDAFENGRLSLAPDSFWCSTWFLTDIPPRIRAAFGGARMVVIKGDFNYRRGMRDTIWPAGVSATQAMGPVGQLPPLLFLRTMKSDVIAGVTDATVAELDAADCQWRINGRRGVIQLVI
jgi:damage-control phosphatase, subfamily III